MYWYFMHIYFMYRYYSFMCWYFMHMYLMYRYYSFMCWYFMHMYLMYRYYYLMCWYFMHMYFGLMSRVFANGPGDRGSIQCRVISKTQKMVLAAAVLNTQHYKVRIKCKVEQFRERVASSPTPWCSSY